MSDKPLISHNGKSVTFMSYLYDIKSYRTYTVVYKIKRVSSVRYTGTFTKGTDCDIYDRVCDLTVIESCPSTVEARISEFARSAIDAFNKENEERSKKVDHDAKESADGHISCTASAPLTSL